MNINDLLQKLEKELLQPTFRKSVSDVGLLLADEFIEIGSSGQFFNKQQVIESLQIEPQGIQRTLTNFKILELAPNIFLAIYKIIEQEKKPIFSLRSSIWKLIDDRWQLIFHQGTLLEEQKQNV